MVCKSFKPTPSSQVSSPEGDDTFAPTYSLQIITGLDMAHRPRDGRRCWKGGLINIERSAMRVLERALSGGHNVSPAEIELNYFGNLLQLDRHFKMLDELRVIDSSETVPKVLLQLLNNEVVFCAPFYDLPEWFTDYLIHITRRSFPNI
jgi:hypothetical protein